MAPCRLLVEKVLDLTADSTEFCPLPGLDNILAVGTYQLLEDRSTRIGKLYIYTVSADQSCTECAIELLTEVDVPGIFDMKWRPVREGSDNACIALALADGRVSVANVEPTAADNAMRYAPISSTDVDLQAMVVSLDFSRGPEQRGDELAASTSSGQLSILQVTDSGLQISQQWTGHDMEAWIVAFDSWKVIFFAYANPPEKLLCQIALSLGPPC